MLPTWIQGAHRATLADYIKGTKPSLVLEKHGLSHSQLADLRRHYGIPSQAKLRQCGLLEPAIRGRKKLREFQQKYGPVFGPKRPRLDEIREQRETRLAQAVAEYLAGGEMAYIVPLAKKHHLSTRELSDTLRAQGVDIKRGRKQGTVVDKPLSERDQAIIKAVIDEGRTLESVARAQKPYITRERVRQIVIKQGHSLAHRRGGRRKEA